MILCAQKDAVARGFSGKPAIEKDVASGLLGRRPVLGGDEAGTSAVDLTALKHGSRIAEAEIDLACYVAIAKILAPIAAKTVSCQPRKRRSSKIA